ncbi:hypothetical protein [Diaphorobacter caeni]|uniref:hypothetical protein n=1 Tax=Diaphorobacter caeni TaxID=2784387 RepID=UPI00189058D6|nr:hypothetical protein [Diaphorobacter caeni]MBF5006968.1 hypothetical protein [Diaphorobacter caeni]
MQTTEHEVEISAELQHRLELLRNALGMPDVATVMERLIGRQLDNLVFDMTGMKPGPRLAVDNTKREKTCQD